MYKDLFTVFGYTVQTHAVVSLIAIFLALGIAFMLTRKTVYEEHVYNFVFWAIIGAIIGARLWHVFVFQWPYFMHHPIEIFAIWQGGISILGAIVGGVVGTILYSYKHRLDFYEFADYLAPAFIFGMGIGRMACFFGGDAFGAPTNLGFGIVFPEGTIAYQTYGAEPLWPVIIFEGQGDLFIFAILLYLLGKKFFKGAVFTAFLFLYGALRFSLEYFRGDSPRYAGLTGGHWTSLGFMIIAIILLVYLLFYRSKKERSTVA